jgi:short-subunit dehydrogenase
VSLLDPTPGTVVVVTGASSGIGQELARALASRGYSLAVVARRRERLEGLATEVRQAHDVAVTVHPADLRDQAVRDELIQELRNDERQLVALCNCAGIGSFGRFDELALDGERAQIALNCAAIVDLVHQLLRPMLVYGSGAILNVGSLASMQPIPHNATYAASKAFVASFSEALHAELAGTGVSCTLISPGPVRTEFAASAGVSRLGAEGPQLIWSDPARVASVAIEAMLAGRRSVVPGTLSRIASISGRFSPRPASLRALAAGTEKLLGLSPRATLIKEDSRQRELP